MSSGILRYRNWSQGSKKRRPTQALAQIALVLLLLLLSRATQLGKPFSSDNFSVRSAASKIPSRRRFISYHSSPWEQDWLDNVDEWSQSKKSMCDTILTRDLERVHDFLNMTCTDWYPPPHEHWCKQEDFVMPMHYNTRNRSAIEWTWRIPLAAMKKVSTRTVAVRPGPEHEHILSKMVFQDEVTGEIYNEYIEPLVAGLRHPLVQCHNGGAPLNSLPPFVFRGYVIPPPERPRSSKMLYFDAGASSWDEGDGGPSLKYFTKIWARQGIDFDAVRAYEMNTTAEVFSATVPEEFRERTVFQQCAVSSSPEEASSDHPFLPLEISRIAQDDDYVLFKLDIDSPLIEDGSIRYILKHDTKVDEIAWEHHVSGNPIMKRIWKRGGVVADMTLRESYELFLQMRQKGIRAHSWV
jgi:hypothetical protein